MEKPEPQYNSAKNVKWCSLCGKQLRQFLRKLNKELSHIKASRGSNGEPGHSCSNLPSVSVFYRCHFYRLVPFIQTLPSILLLFHIQEVQFSSVFVSYLPNADTYFSRCGKGYSWNEYGMGIFFHVLKLNALLFLLFF